MRTALHLATMAMLGMLIPPARAQNAADAFVAARLAEGRCSPNEQMDSLRNVDLAGLWLKTPSQRIYGFRNPDFERLRMKFVKVRRDPYRAKRYLVYGKSAFRGSVTEFWGNLQVSGIRRCDPQGEGHTGDTTAAARYILFGSYLFVEGAVARPVARLVGKFVTDFYIDAAGRAQYDDIDAIADGFCNNQFIGTRIPTDGSARQTCNWGDHRIPDSSALDCGAADFFPCDPFIQNGWNDLQLLNSPGPEGQRAREREEAYWWE